MQLSDYAQALGAAQKLVPDLRDIRTQELQQQGLVLRNAGFQQEQDAAARQQAYVEDRRRAFQDGLARLGARPSPAALSRFGLDFPEFGKVIGDAASQINEDQRVATVKKLAPLQALIANGKTSDALAMVQRHIDADKAAGLTPDEDDVHLAQQLASGDPTSIKAAGGTVYGLLAALNPDTAAKNIADRGDGQTKGQVVGRAIGHYEDGKWVTDYRDPDPEANAIQVPIYDDQGNRVGTQLVANGGKGGDPVSGGGGSVASGPVDRLINSDAGGGYVPDGVQTIGQFVSWGRGMNKRGATSSSAGRYQINGTTMAEFAPAALGENWSKQPFNAENQDKVGEAIFNWAKRQSNPAAALKGRWVSLTDGEAQRLVRGDWLQARGLIAQKETGGSGGASANAGSGSPRSANGTFGPVPSNRQGYQILTSAEVAASGLNPNVKYQRSPDGQITAIGGQTKGQLKPLPVAATNAIQENVSTIKQIDNAIAEIRKRPGSIGTGTGAFGDTFTQWNDPGGTTARSAVGKIGGQIIHDVSGAAVTLSEAPRFMPYVPTVTDRPEVALTKLAQLKKLALGQLAEQRDYYSEQNGFRPYRSRYLDGGGQQQSAPPKNSGFRILKVRPK